MFFFSGGFISYMLNSKYILLVTIITSIPIFLCAFMLLKKGITNLKTDPYGSILYLFFGTLFLLFPVYFLILHFYTVNMAGKV